MPDIETRMHAVIARLYEAALDPHDWPGALDAMADICGGMGVTLFPMQATPNGFSYVSGAVAEAASTYFSDWIERCPRIAYDARHPIINRCFWDGEILDEATLKGDPYFHDYARSYDLQYSVVRTTTALSDGGRHVLSSPFSLKTGKPSDENLARFALLSGHAVRALTIHQALDKAEQAKDIFCRLLDNRGCGVIVLNASGYVIHMNGLAERLTQDGLLVVNRRLQASASGQQPMLARTLAAALSSDRNRTIEPIALRRGRNRLPLILQAAPLAASSDHRPLSQLTFGRGGAVITLVDPEFRQEQALDQTFVLLGLTPAEARVAALLATGASPQAAAADLGLSTGTIRNHLKSIFAKLDITRQAELVALAGRIGGAGRQG